LAVICEYMLRHSRNLHDKLEEEEEDSHTDSKIRRMGVHLL